MDRPGEPFGRIAVGVGTIGALVVAGLLANVRGDAGSANVALVLACVVVAAALAGRLAGAATAVTAALAYDYFHTRPYYSLRVDTVRDVVTIGLLLIIGLAVSGVSARRRTAHAAEQRQRRVAQQLESTAAALAAGGASAELWTEVRSALVEALALADCRFEPGPTTSLPQIPRTGALSGRELRFRKGGFALPPDGATIPAVVDGQTLGHVVLVPQFEGTSTLDARRAAIALVDLFAVALDRPGVSPPPTGTDSRPPSR
ncbi:MAG: PAS domain-containing sensor histidine kinase [Actinobacteria bacterium]|nr:PAS domain-containing sensor histidine kinase [Actinomycetota bacterium]